MARGESMPLEVGPIKHDRVPAKNVTGGTVRRGEVLQFTGLAVDALEREAIVLNGDEYTTATEYSSWGLTLSPMDEDDIDNCLVVGIGLAHVTVGDASHKYARPVSGSKVLASATSGPARIIYKPSGTGEKECVVLLGWDGPQIHIGKTDATHNKGATGSVSRWAGNTLADTGLTDSVVNNFGNLASGKWIIYTGIDGKFYAISGEC